MFLQTVRALASVNHGDTSVCVRILFDSGIQLSYVTEKLQTKLGLRQTRIEKLYFNTFGNNGYKTQSCAMVKLYLRGLRNSFYICIDFSSYLVATILLLSK